MSPVASCPDVAKGAVPRPPNFFNSSSARWSDNDASAGLTQPP
jgi:hypothetical protein